MIAASTSRALIILGLAFAAIGFLWPSISRLGLGRGANQPLAFATSVRKVIE